MSDKKLSLFELHFHDRVQLGPKTLDGPVGDGDGEANENQPAETPSADEPAGIGEAGDDEGSGSSLVRRLVGLGVLAAAAYAVGKLLGGEPNGLDALDDVESDAEEDGSGEPVDSEEAVSIEVTSGEESTSAGRTGLAAAAVVALLLVLALLARKLLGDAADELELPEELAED